MEGPTQSISLDGSFQGSLTPDKAVPISLGMACTDDNGRLIFVGGSGYSQCVSHDKQYNPDKDYPGQPDITSEFDSIDWVDTMCDGVISVKFAYDTDSSSTDSSDAGGSDADDSDTDGSDTGSSDSETVPEWYVPHLAFQYQPLRYISL